MTLDTRLGLALAPGGVSIPEGRIAVFGPRAGQSLEGLPMDRVEVITGFFPDHAHFEGRGYSCRFEPEGFYAAALVVLPRAKALARSWVAMAAAAANGPVLVDGAKETGVESLLRDCRRRVEVEGRINKAHGKLFWFEGGDFADWLPGPANRVDGFVTAPGTFSADGIDPASALLAASLPETLGARIVDLGAGWGYLSAAALERKGVKAVELVEAERAALDCARRNITDPRAVFHWADATTWRPEARVDAVVTNPPFHTDRKADPELGRAFIRSAAAMLTPRGQLWLVANRHLPYERVIADLFDDHREVAGTGAFKVIRASGPRADGPSRHRRHNSLV
ncbi:methyltransferase, putative [Pseudooceanicola batsensis HTCC2597]|uniref:Methyltransferase, putative n=1 Tax=Pseudooceanicola batsensis (strain ATCC BAA-863 / DSM 15984 / KCTC 12145 / HTCC2597) TaxID=252305 RepID=A3TVK4_PSEBH|nr:methyltransferase [Pseudooceanicola batsensis]EAQ03650.1 methyltransferase, putative [Pseudooceanicola batsensis HTCC2597]